MALVLEVMSSTHEAKVWSPALHQQGMVAHAYKSSTGKGEAGRSVVQGLPLHSEFAASLGHTSWRDNVCKPSVMRLPHLGWIRGWGGVGSSSLIPRF